MLAVAVPVAVIEGTGVREALNRSSKLTDGDRWGIFGVAFCLGLVLLVPIFGILTVGRFAFRGDAGVLAESALLYVVDVASLGLQGTVCVDQPHKSKRCQRTCTRRCTV